MVIHNRKSQNSGEIAKVEKDVMRRGSIFLWIVFDKQTQFDPENLLFGATMP